MSLFIGEQEVTDFIEDINAIKKYIQEVQEYSLLKSKEKYILFGRNSSEAELLLDTETMIFYTPKYDYKGNNNFTIHAEDIVYFNRFEYLQPNWKKLTIHPNLPKEVYRENQKPTIGLDYSKKTNYIIFYTLFFLLESEECYCREKNYYYSNNDKNYEWTKYLNDMIPSPVKKSLKKLLNFNECLQSVYSPDTFECLVNTLWSEENNSQITSNSQKLPLKKLTPPTLENNLTELKKYQIFIDYIDDLVTQIDQSNTKSSNRLYHQLSTLKNGNSTLQNIQNYLSTKFDASFENLKEELIGFKLESVEYLEKIDNQNSIFELHKLSQQSIDFTFLYEVIAQRYNKHLEQISNFENNQEFFTQLYQRVEKLFKENNNFIHGKKNQLLQILKDNCIEEEIENIYAEWQNEIEKLNLAHLSLIKAYFHGQISQTLLLSTLDILFVIQEKLEEFFETTRSGIFINYQNNPKKELLQKVDTQSRIFDIYKTTHSQFIEIIKEEKSLTYQKNLSKNINQLIDFNFYEEKGFEMISDEFITLTKKNLEIYFSDIEQYGKELEKRDMEIGKLFFKMKKNLEKEK